MNRCLASIYWKSLLGEILKISPGGDISNISWGYVVCTLCILFKDTKLLSIEDPEWGRYFQYLLGVSTNRGWFFIINLGCGASHTTEWGGYSIVILYWNYSTSQAYITYALATPFRVCQSNLPDLPPFLEADLEGLTYYSLAPLKFISLLKLLYILFIRK